MKKILLSCNSAWGMYNFRAGVIERLVNVGYDVHVIVPVERNYTDRLKDLGGTIHNIAIDSKGMNPIRDFKLLCTYIKQLKAIRPDICFFYTIKPNIYGSLAASLLGIPYVAFVTGLGYVFIEKTWLTILVKYAYKIALCKAKQVWFLNKEDLSTFIRKNIVKSGQTVILNGEGIDTEGRFGFSKLTAQNTDELQFIMPARMLWDKGVGEFVAAAHIIVSQKNTNASFALLGALDKGNPKSITVTEMDELTKDGCVKYLGFADDIRIHVGKCACVVLPSAYREGIPFTLLEGAAMCKPLITTDTPGCRNVVEDGVNGFLCKVKDVDSLVECMERIIKVSPEERQAMGRKGREKVEKEFSLEAVIKQYMETIERFSKK